MPTFSLWTAEAEKRRGRQSQKWFGSIFSNKVVKILQIFFLSLYCTLFLLSNVVLTILSSHKSKFKISSQPLIFLAIFNQKWAHLPHIIYSSQIKKFKRQSLLTEVCPRKVSAVAQYRSEATCAAGRFLQLSGEDKCATKLCNRVQVCIAGSDYMYKIFY